MPRISELPAISEIAGDEGLPAVVPGSPNETGRLEINLLLAWLKTQLAAGDIGVTPVGGISAEDVQAALAELDSEKAAASALGALASKDAAGNADLSDMSQATIKGRAAGGGTGKPTDLSGAQVAAILAGTDLDSRGLQTISVPAAAMTPRTTSGAEDGSVESSSNKVMYSVLDFDPATDEFAQFQVAMPKGWNEGTITAQFLWLSASGTGNVVWGLQAVAIGDDDPLDAAFGTAQTVTDGVTAATDVMISAATAAVTIGGSPSEGDLVTFQVYRDADSGSDTLAADARLIGVRLLYTTNAATDA